MITYGYLFALLVHFAPFFLEHSKSAVVVRSMPSGNPPSFHRLDFERQKLAERLAAAGQAVSFLLYEQFFLILLVTPAITAGALGYEKEGSTLEPLLCTELTSWEIVTSKLLGRMCVLARIICVPLPLLVLCAALADLQWGQFLLALLFLTVLTFFLTAACILSAVWTRRTSDAILACYATLIILFLAYQTFVASNRFGWLDPIIFLYETLSVRELIRPLGVILHIGGMACAGVVCFVLAVKSLRAASSRLVEQRPARWLWAFRPPIGRAPVRWREQHVIGLAPLPWLRIIPGSLGKLGVFSFSLALALTAFPNFLWSAFRPALEHGDFAYTGRLLGQIRFDEVIWEVSLMGFVLLLGGSIVVGVRCGTSISEEKRRKTWEDLILTSLSVKEIAQDKRWGILQATVPYVIVYMVPMFAMSAIGRGAAIGWAIAWVIAAGGSMILISLITTSFVSDAEGERERQRSAPRHLEPVRY
jgi:ABC-type Na+ efflux pump permease subunit